MLVWYIITVRIIEREDMLLIEQNDEKYNNYIVKQFQENFIKSMVNNRILPEKYAKSLFYPISEKKEV